MVNAKVMFDYGAEQPDELSLNVGDIVNDIDMQDGGWWEGEVNGKRGMFPENFVEIIKAEPPPPEKPAAAAAPSPQEKSCKQVRVTFQYSPEQSDEIALEVGEIVDIIDDAEDGWCKGRVGDRVGMFPSNFVEPYEGRPAEQEERPTPQPPPTIPQSEPVPDPVETGVKSARPKSQMGFGISLGDLSRNKLKKTGLADSSDAPKKAQAPVPPAPEPVREVEEKPVLVAQPPAPAKPMVTKTIQKARANFSYEPDQEDELPLAVNDIIIIRNKEIFAGWMEGELNGRVGVFPDNFVTLLPPETVTVEESTVAGNHDIKASSSVRRPGKDNPAEQKQPPPAQPPVPSPTEKKQPPPPLMGGGNPLQQELANKLQNKRPPPPVNTAAKPKPGKPPGLPTKPKPAPPLSKKPTPAAPPAKPPHPSESAIERAGSISARTASLSNKNTSLPRTFSGSQNNKSPPTKPKKVTKDGSIDLDVVKSNDPLKHMQRAKPPPKNLPGKFQNSDDSPQASVEPVVQPSSAVSKDVEDAKPSVVVAPAAVPVTPVVPSVTPATTTNTAPVADSKEVNELKSQVADLQGRMGEMEKKFKKLLNQVHDQLDEERKSRMNQQVEVDRLKRKLELLEDH